MKVALIRFVWFLVLCVKWWQKAFWKSSTGVGFEVWFEWRLVKSANLVSIFRDEFPSKALSFWSPPSEAPLCRCSSVPREIIPPKAPQMYRLFWAHLLDNAQVYPASAPHLPPLESTRDVMLRILPHLTKSKHFQVYTGLQTECACVRGGTCRKNTDTPHGKCLKVLDNRHTWCGYCHHGICGTFIRGSFFTNLSPLCPARLAACVVLVLLLLILLCLGLPCRPLMSFAQVPILFLQLENNSWLNELHCCLNKVTLVWKDTPTCEESQRQIF